MYNKLKIAMVAILSMMCGGALAMRQITHMSTLKSAGLSGDVFSLALGDGYSTDNMMSMGQTAINNLDKIPITYSDIQSSINMNNTISLDELAEDFNIDMSASGGWGIYSWSASASYMRHISSTDYSDNFTYAEQFYKNARLNISQLPHTPNGLTSSALDEYNNYGIQAFTNLYGDSFIQQLPLGAMLSVNIQINFSTLSDKNSFNAAMSGGAGGIFNASMNMQDAVSKSHAKGSVEVSAYQIGGDPSQLANIFSQQADGSYYITNCTLDNLTACSGALNGVIDYSKNNFSKQISNDVPIGNFVVVGAPVLLDYVSEFNLQYPPYIDPTILKAQDQLTKMYQQTFKDKTFVDHILSVPSIQPYITTPSKQALETAQQSLDWNLSLFSRYQAISCYISSRQSNCPKIVQDIQQGSEPVDPTILATFTNGYNCISPGNIGVPIGIDQYIFISDVPNSTVTIKQENNGQILTIDGHNIRGSVPDEFIGSLPKTGDGTYEGTVHFDDGVNEPYICIQSGNLI